MFARVFLVVALLAGTWPASAETIQLKDQAAVSGKILAEKRDQVVVELGFTVLSIPKSYIAKISRDTAPDPKASSKNGRPSTNGRPATATKTVEAPTTPTVAGPQALYQGARPGLEEQSG